jgi:hypothetical protein
MPIPLQQNETQIFLLEFMQVQMITTHLSNTMMVTNLSVYLQTRWFMKYGRASKQSTCCRECAYMKSSTSAQTG